MIELIEGDLFVSGARALVNPANTVGTMGGGLAREFKRRFLFCVKPYEQLCKAGRFYIGDVLACESPKDPGFYVVHVPTKVHWREPSELTYVEQGVEALARWISESGVASVAVPALGCGLGGLEWTEVRPVIEAALASVPARVLLYPPR